MSILVNVVNQKMYVSSHADGFVAGSQQFVQFKFNLSSEWDGLMTFAQFRQGTEAYNQYLDEENCVYLPSEIGAGTCTMMLYGSHDTTIGTTNYLTFRIGKNNLVADAESTDISQSLYDQLVTKINKLTSWNGKSIADLGADVQDLQSQVSSEVARAKASEEANAAAIGLKANQLQVDELEVKVERLTNNEVVSGLIDTAVKEEMSNYLNSGLLAQLAIEDGCVTREKLSTDVCASLNQISDNSDRITTLEDTAANQSEDIQDLQDNFSSVHAEISKAIRYDKQSLANTQKQQARQNIGAMGTTADSSLNMNGYNINNVETISMHQGSPDTLVIIYTGDLERGRPVVVFGVDEQDGCLPPVLRNVSDGIEDTDAATVGQVKAVNLLHEYGIKIPSKYNGSIVSAEPYNVIDEDGHITYTRLRFIEATDDRPVRLAGLYPGQEDTDAATVGQLRENLLTVTVDEDNVASATPAEIYAHVQSGGTAVLLWQDRFYGYSHCTIDDAYFAALFEDQVDYLVWISDVGKVVENELQRVPLSLFDSTIGDIDSALDEIIKIQEELLIPNGDEVSY